MSNLENILELFASGQRGCNVDDSGNALECVGKITPDKVLDDGYFNLATVLGVRLPQRVSLPRPRDSNETLDDTISYMVIPSPSNAVALFQEAYQNV